MTRRHPPTPLEPADVRVKTRGTIRGDDVEHARLTVAALTRLAHGPVLDARVKLTAGPGAGPGGERPCTAQANLDVNGRPVRAQAVAASAHQAIHLLHDRLRVRLRRDARGWENPRGHVPGAPGAPGDREWQRGGAPRRPLPYAARPIGERRVVRHKTYALNKLDPDEAAAEMERLDYDFHLFTEATTGVDSFLRRAGGGYRLAQVTPRLTAAPEPITLSPAPAPRLTAEEAVARLEATGLPFVFFANAGTGRGHVLYHRYDGDYGLLAAAG
ncbi:sigma 54 modulation/S30EA ribosomal C-terminal domain-containing protein [Actinomadura sp. ATCC 31491]|uniref:Sigma 54 modulation/S30EA ribosomal C-terminal domain-containing protein n=1 Tax=Actinomadura luzonensis TaxID=2805427 RepID=A0ABT0G6P2_9ACTN|nr:sigma 54 modulation/S30EA ribosomal C-terminal domain-containing protein [Actinomadura luzonensis]MCK2220280.1 sigma 54 modulation/S30EA ribosomal C-terminal domain-containing protein [Actinomadura luzonensis]